MTERSVRIRPGYEVDLNLLTYRAVIIPDVQPRRDFAVILLINPPVSKPSEPPAGIGRLSGMLSRQGIAHDVLDANLEGLLSLIKGVRTSSPSRGIWTTRAFRKSGQNVASLRTPAFYRKFDAYKRAVLELNHVLDILSVNGMKMGLANFQNEKLSPVRSSDLLSAAEAYLENPFYPYFSSRVRALMESGGHRFIGISLNYMSQALSAFAIAGFIKDEFPQVKTIMGGGLVTSWMKGTDWKNPFAGLVDYFVAGPGEDQLARIIGIKTEQTSFTPEYHAMPLKDYLSPGLILPYSASVGCYWNKCNFCPERAEGNGYAPIPAETAVAEIETLANSTDPTLIHFLDSAVSTSLMETLSKKQLGLPWYGFSRVSSTIADPDFCISLRKSGCVMLKLGLESGDQKVLDDMQKGINLATVSAALKALKEAGIGVYAYLMFGTPEENAASAQKTLDFTVTHRNYIDFLNVAIFNMPVSVAERRRHDVRTFYEGDLSLYSDFVHPAGWDRREVRTFLENVFRRHPAIARILRREPPVFTSNHAPFFLP